MDDIRSKEASGTVARSVRVLRFISERNVTTIREAAAALMLPPSTVHRLFDLLAREGMIEADRSDHTYRPGPEFFRIASQVVGRYDLRTLALPVMHEVVAACEETCVFGLYLPSAGKMTIAERVDSTLPLRYHLPMNTHMSLITGASGRCILAFLPPAEAERIIAQERSSGSRQDAAMAPQALRDIKVIRKQGFAVSRGEIIAGAMAIAAPVIGAEGHAVASLGVTAPNERMQRTGVERVSNLVRDAARRLSLRLGAPPGSMPAADAAVQGDARRRNGRRAG